MSRLLLLYSDTSSGPSGPVAYKYYKFVITAWNDATWFGSGEIGLYDNLDNLGNVGIGNGQLDIHGTSGTASAGSATAAPASDAADGNNTTTRWLTNVLPGYWKFAFTVTPTNPILGYTYWSANSGPRSPNAFTFEGSQDNTEWTVLDTQTGLSYVAAYEAKNFTI